MLLFVIICLPADTETPVNVGIAEPSSFKQITKNGVTYVGDRDFFVSNYTYSAKKGEAATITVTSNKNTTVSITVYYSSGASSSSVFVPKEASPEQSATWQWKLPVNTSARRVRVVLRSENTYAQLYISVI